MSEQVCPLCHGSHTLSQCKKWRCGVAVKADPLAGFACVLRDHVGQEFLAMQTFGESRGKAKRAALAMNCRRANARKPPLEILRVCEVGVRVLQGQPPVDNRFVADGCELFAAGKSLIPTLKTPT